MQSSPRRRAPAPSRLDEGARAELGRPLYDVRKLLHGASLVTVCEEARCPNIGECWGRGTATFQILGDTCTRACRYCYVNSGSPSTRRIRSSRFASRRPRRRWAPPRRRHVRRPRRPRRPGRRPLRRDDPRSEGEAPRLVGRGAHARLLGAEEEALSTVLGARPEVFNHNIETVRRLHRRMRGAKATYDGALWLLRRAKEVADYP